ncbi:hypothetical protein [Undibacterium luofuense]|uniref:hypothetical protein n=1 Tax=Undibacterium luofuense TaxID=2828733 RepID=UPI003C6F715C
MTITAQYSDGPGVPSGNGLPGKLPFARFTRLEVAIIALLEIAIVAQLTRAAIVAELAMFARLIDDFVAVRGVHPAKVYLLGYSAGGDGVWQLAPRMPDRFAASPHSTSAENRLSSGRSRKPSSRRVCMRAR